MRIKFHHLKNDKTKVIAFGGKEDRLRISARLISTPGLKTAFEISWSQTFISHIKEVTKTAFYHLKNTAQIKGLLSLQDLKKQIHTFITSRVDFCNGLLVRVLTKTWRTVRSTPGLASLHWLPVNFKVLLLVYQSQKGLDPEYTSDMLKEYKLRSALRSMGAGQLVVPRTQSKHSEEAFSFYAAQNWNQLTENVL